MTLMIRRTAILTLALTAALVTGSWGCGQSKEEAAMERLKNTVPPAKIRMVNLSSDPITMVADIGALESNLESNLMPGQSCLFRVLPSGDKEVVFKSGDRVIGKISRKFDPRKPYTVVLADSGNGIGLELIDDEMESPTSTMNVKTYYVGLDGDAPSVSITLTSGDQSYTIKPGSGEIRLAAGNYTLSGDGVTDTDVSSVEDRGMYSLFVVDAADGKRFAYLIQNNPAQVPQIGGQA